MNSDLTSFDKIEQKIGGSRKISNYIIGGMLTIGGIGFLLASISSYTGRDLLPLGNPSTLLFIPQGIIMGAYGVIANLLNFYLWYLVYINFGSGSNYFDKSSKSVEIKRKGLFKDIETPFVATRYHSLIVDSSSLPTCFDITATLEDSTIMAISHKEYKHLHGVQFHPESVLTQFGHKLISNFLKMAEKK